MDEKPMYKKLLQTMKDHGASSLWQRGGLPMLPYKHGYIPSGVFVCVFYASTSNARLDFNTTAICEKVVTFLLESNDFS